MWPHEKSTELLCGGSESKANEDARTYTMH